jgi:ionotropic kainate glutamate receptor 2
MRVSLEGHHIKVVSAYSPPAVTYIEDNCTSRNCFKGMFADVWNDLAEKLNFTYSIKKAYQWGSFSNGTWNGMVGMIERGISDIAVTDLSMTKDRSSAVDFLPSLMETSEELFINHPGESLSLDGYTAPFSFSSWVGVILWLIIVPIILAGIALYGDDQYSNEFGLGSCYGFVAQVFMMHSNATMPSTNSSRIAFGSVLVGGIIIYYYWEAELFAHLAVRKTNLPFYNLRELSKYSEYKLLVGRGTIHLDHLKYSNDPVLQQIWKEKIEPYANELPLYQDMVKTALDRGHSVIYSESGLRQHQAYIDCKIIDVGTPLYTSQLAWAVKKRSHFYRTFGYQIKKLKEIGAVQKSYKTYVNQNQLCPDYSGNPLGVKQCITAFKFMSSGILFGLLWLLLEILAPQKWIKWFLNTRNKFLKNALIQKSVGYFIAESFNLKQRRRNSC